MRPSGRPQRTVIDRLSPGADGRPLARLVSTLVLGALLTSCAAPASIRQAAKGNFESSRASLESEPLNNLRELRRLAAMSLSADIAAAESIEDRDFIRSLRPCHQELTRALKRRARRHDAVAAEAARLLLASEDYPRRQARRHLDSEDGAWRAVAARTTGDDDDTALRQLFFEDEDQRVRRAALEAALEARLEIDREPLLEVARLDPDPLVRSRAYQVLGALGGEHTLRALKDRFEQAKEPDRLAILDAWGQAALRSEGGDEKLERVVEQETGFVQLHAAYLLLQSGSPRLREKGLRRLLHLAQHGSTEERRLALRRLPAGDDRADQILVASTTSDDPQVQLIAWARLTGRPEYRRSALEKLLAWAASDHPGAYQARAALAAAGAEEARDFFVQQAEHREPAVRRVAGYGLLRLGEAELLAPLLVDASPEVRQPIACRLLAH